MGTNFDSDYIEQAWPDLLAEHGEDVNPTYTPFATGTPASVPGIFTETTIDEIFTAGDDQQRTATFEVARTDVANPLPKDQVTARGIVWVVMSAQAQDEGTTMLTLEYVEQVAVFRDGHQRDR